MFVTVSDPVGVGFVATLSHPGANITGFVNLQPRKGGKWLEFLKEIAPKIQRAAIMFNPIPRPEAVLIFCRHSRPPRDPLASCQSRQPFIVRPKLKRQFDAWRTAAKRSRRRVGWVYLCPLRKVISGAPQYKVPAVSDRTLPTQ